MACLDGLPGESLYSLKRTWQHRLIFQSLLDQCPWTYKTTVEMFGHNTQHHVCTDILCLVFTKLIITIVKHSGGGVMIWALFPAMGPGHLTVIESTLNPSVYQSIVEFNVRPSVWLLKLGWNSVMQQKNDSKHSSKSTIVWLKEKRITF